MIIPYFNNIQFAELSRELKFQKKLERKNKEKSGDLESMMAYLDEDGNITTKPLEESEETNPLNNNNNQNERNS